MISGVCESVAVFPLSIEFLDFHLAEDLTVFCNETSTGLTRVHGGDIGDPQDIWAVMRRFHGYWDSSIPLFSLELFLPAPHPLYPSVVSVNAFVMLWDCIFCLMGILS